MTVSSTYNTLKFLKIYLSIYIYIYISIYLYIYIYTSLAAQLVKNHPAMQETWVQSLGWEDPLEMGTATHSSILAWRIPWRIVHGVVKRQARLSDFHFIVWMVVPSLVFKAHHSSLCVHHQFALSSIGKYPPSLPFKNIVIICRFT